MNGARDKPLQQVQSYRKHHEEVVAPSEKKKGIQSSGITPDPELQQQSFIRAQKLYSVTLVQERKITKEEGTAT